MLDLKPTFIRTSSRIDQTNQTEELNKKTKNIKLSNPNPRIGLAPHLQLSRLLVALPLQPNVHPVDKVWLQKHLHLHCLVLRTSGSGCPFVMPLVVVVMLSDVMMPSPRNGWKSVHTT